MATVDFLRKTKHDATFVVRGTGSASVNASDLLITGQTISGTPRFDILQMYCTGAPGATMTVTRNSKLLYTLNTQTRLDLLLIGGTKDSTENDSPIQFNATGGDFQCIMKVRKTDGFVDA